MPCNHSQLNALTDGELGIWAAARLRRHLRTCPTCAEEYEAIQNLGLRMQAWRDVTAPAGLEARIASVLPQARQTTAQKRFTWRPLAAVAVAGVVFAAIVLFTPGQPGQPAIAFADVERAMQNIQTARWVETTTDFNSDGSVGEQYASELWVRTEPPAEARISLPQSFHPYPGESLDDLRTLFDSRGQTTYDATAHRYSLDPMPFHPALKSKAARDQFLQSMVRGDLILPRERAEATAPQSRAYGPIQTRISASRRVSLDGRPVIRFESENTLRSGDGETVATVIFADPDTRRIVRRETRFIKSGHLTRLEVCDHYGYNEAPPPDTFNLTPPPGVTVEITRPELRPPGDPLREAPVRLSPADKKAIERVITQSHFSWLQGNWANFAAVWDFDYYGVYQQAYLKAHPEFTPARKPTVAQHRHNWKSFVLAQRGHWEWWKAPQITGIRALPTLHALKVTAHHKYKLKGNPKPLEADMTYYLRHTAQGWCIFTRGEL
ncbi:MAG: zf-HC2 domain-containing protein [Armatimonadota bacterium]|nr:zf-HC2 domain-containing protein [Armatimonadota bacterium]